MLEIKYISDVNELAPLAEKLGMDLNKSGASFVLFENGVSCGICRVKVTDRAEITDFKLLPEHDDFETRDFFFRALLFKFSFNPIKIFIGCKDERLRPFGFTETDNGMEVNSFDIVFPRSCGG